MKKSSFKIEFNTELQYLKRYFKRSTSNPKYSCLEQMIIDRKEELFHPYFETDINHGFKTNKKRTPEALKRLELEEQDTLLKIYQTWIIAIEKHLKMSDINIVRVVKDVYVNKNMDVETAGMKYLHYGKTRTYEILYNWFQELNITFFNERK
ncbi:hypothetical protein [Streptococcus equinus]|jgi:hypothetical protein|uniref:hypothetical protein n=1 Tax=Streptococcus equinus TaxID=1335 RepID=UPI000888BF73|nr:hypothetical protein [Streptococcus equinus]SDJ00511.1 hypothetical protein SAMN05216384_10844 [Streptococcus equinus]SEP95348.1 hypothetical protein SAMN05216477_10844 [Streptococcus equinus]